MPKTEYTIVTNAAQAAIDWQKLKKAMQEAAKAAASVNVSIPGVPNPSASFLAANPQLAQRRGAQYIIPPEFRRASAQAMKMPDIGIAQELAAMSARRGASELAIQHQAMVAMEDFAINKKLAANAAKVGAANERVLAQQAMKAAKMPDITTQMAAKMNWKQMALGAAAGLFSPWIGARMMNSAMGGDGAGGGGKGVSSTIFGAGGVAGFAEFFIGLQVASKALTGAFHELVSAVQRGTQLYGGAARAGTSTGTLAHLRNTFASIGLSPDLAERMMETGRLAKGPKMGLNGTLIGAASGVASKSELNQIMNMGPEIAAAWKATEGASKRSAINARALFETSMAFEGFKAEWNSFWENLAASPALRKFLTGMTHWLEGVNIIADKADKFTYRTMVESAQKHLASGFGLMNKYGAFEMKQAVKFARDHNLFPQEREFKPGLSQAISSRPTSAWEKMGLIIHGGGLVGNDYARQTALNTKKMADAMTARIQGHMNYIQQNPTYNAP